MKFQVVDLGLVEYGFANRIQSQILNEVKSNAREGVLIFAEFFPVYTIGRCGSLNNLLVSPDFLKEKGVGIYNVNRGGDITAHNPGQLVVYPIFNLSALKKDLNWYLRSLEEVIINLLLKYGIYSQRKNGLTGVWVGDKKIASIGIAVSKWVTSHGISLNVNNDLTLFDFINPCGMKNCRITSISELKGCPIDMKSLKTEFIEQIKIIFGLKQDANIKTAAMA